MVQQYKAFWSIPGAGPSVSTFHAQASSALSAQSLATNIRAFFAAITAYLPNEVSVSFDSEVATLDTATGELTGVQAVAAPGIVLGTGSGAWAAGAGLRVVWATSTINRGRRVRGATFLVPCTVAAFNTSGTPSGTAVADINAAAATLISEGGLDSAELLVYSRPIPGFPGLVSLVESGAVDNMAATLRGRKQ